MKPNIGAKEKFQENYIINIFFLKEDYQHFSKYWKIAIKLNRT